MVEHALNSLMLFAQGWPSVFLPLAISATYFFSSPASERLGRRMLASLHGITIAVLYFAAMVIFQFGWSNRAFGLPFLIASGVPLTLILTSFFVYRGPRIVHALQIVNLASLAWTLFIGSMAVTGDWL